MVAAGDPARARALVEANLAACEGLGWAGHVARTATRCSGRWPSRWRVRPRRARTSRLPRRGASARARSRWSCARPTWSGRIQRADGDEAGARVTLGRARELAELGGFGAFLRAWAAG